MSGGAINRCAWFCLMRCGANKQNGESMDATEEEFADARLVAVLVCIGALVLVIALLVEEVIGGQPFINWLFSVFGG